MADSLELLAALNKIVERNPAAHILSKAQNMLRNPNIEVGDLEQLLSPDASLAAEVIRISNSTFYSYSTPSVNLHDSISRIGFKELHKVIGIAISKGLFTHELSHYNMQADDYWSESILSAFIMEALAILSGANHQEYYLLGLMSNIGKSVNNDIMDQLNIDEVWNMSQPVHEWEAKVLEFDYAYSGAQLLKRWEFPDEFTGTISGQCDWWKTREQTPGIQALKCTAAILKTCGLDYTLLQSELGETVDFYIEELSIDKDQLIEKLTEADKHYKLLRKDFGLG